MNKIPFSHSKARLFGTLNKNDIKIRIPIFFACSIGGRLEPRKTNEWEMWVKTFFLSFSFLDYIYLLLSHSDPSLFRPRKLSNFVVFPRPKWILSSELRIKFKWKLDGIPGEEIGLWRIWIAVESCKRKREWSRETIVYARK